MTRVRDQQVVRGIPGTRACLLGNHAIVRGAIEAGVQLVACYPGTPSSEIGDTFASIAEELGIHFEYSVNEKVAVEVAFAACLTGARVLCSMKHLGLNYANDPISSMPYVGVEGGMVIVAAGDPSALTSPNEQDQRHFNRFLYYPVFDPATPDDALQMTRFAFAFSEETRLPVVLRPTARVCHGSGMVELGSIRATRNEIRFRKDPARYVPVPANARRMRLELSERWRRAEQLLGESPFFPRTGSGPRGVVASGVATAYAAQVIEELGLQDEISLLQIGAYPIPEEVLAGFLESVDSVLVLEELTPFVEEHVRVGAFNRGLHIPVRGKLSGHLPVEFAYSPEIVEDALRDDLGLPARPPDAVVVPDLPDRPAVLCPGCPHRNSFYLTRRVFGKKTVYCNDIGCYTLGYGEPLESCDVLLCMGSSISQASGIARTTGERTVAFIGDSTFFHSGLPALANAVQALDPITVVILDNFVTAMTGFQPSVTTVAPEMSRSGRISIDEVVRALGVQDVETVDPFDTGATMTALRHARESDGVSVVICRSPCVIHERRLGSEETNGPFMVNPRDCNACSLCVRLLGCPAIHVMDQQYLIDQDLCVGCRLCAEVCQRDAIHPMSQCEYEVVSARTTKT